MNLDKKTGTTNETGIEIEIGIGTEIGIGPETGTGIAIAMWTGAGTRRRTERVGWTKGAIAVPQTLRKCPVTASRAIARLLPSPPPPPPPPPPGYAIRANPMRVLLADRA